MLLAVDADALTAADAVTAAVDAVVADAISAVDLDVCFFATATAAIAVVSCCQSTSPCCSNDHMKKVDFLGIWSELLCHSVANLQLNQGCLQNGCLLKKVEGT